MKTRTQTKQKFYGKTSIAFSEHYQCAAVLESDLEVDFFNLKEYENDFDNFEMQPEPIFYYVNGKKTRYTPDAVGIKDGVATYIEIKYAETADKPDLVEKHALIEELYEAKGAKFKVETELEIRGGHRPSNLSYFKPALSHPSPVQELSDLLRYTRKTHMHIHDFHALQRRYKAKDCLVRRAIAHKLIECDLTLHLDDLELDFSSFLQGSQAIA